MGVFAQAPDHEQVVFCHDRSSGLRAIVAIYSTALGPSLGGTRFYPYGDEDAALADVLDLSRAMAYKNAVAGLAHGGGKAVIIGDPATDKTEPLLRAYGSFVASLGGRYYTACDVGTYVEDMDVVAQECRYTTGRSPANGGAGDSSLLTAFGVFQGMRAAADAAWGSPSLAGRRVGIAGVGKVGRRLTEHLLADGASVVVADVDAAAVVKLQAAYPSIDVAAPDNLVDQALDVYSPCALGHALTDDVVVRLQAEIVCGGANNQLDHAGTEALLAERGILFAPDYVVNAGGVIQVADEVHGYDEARATAKAAEILDTTAAILASAASQGITPSQAADTLAEQRMAAAGGRPLRLPGDR
ncbi:MAG TPA: Glu/Leu/Phe/Val dehydrogenase dimerization domain-containing protein [Mycobacteriales bacterium]|nr:Glu/Leu/Phe/Val dehydrogenase dimerization domain-containing protein [Mycobacteriales bacterium]